MAGKKIVIGVIGYGYWGQHIVRNFLHTPGCTVAVVCDTDPEALANVSSRYPEMRTVADPLLLVNDPAVDAVAIVTPVLTHYALAKAALEQGKHVLVEKPLTGSVTEARELQDLAISRGLLLVTDHTFLYTGAVRKIRQLISDGEIGNLRYFDSTRINLGLFQPDVNVLWDLASHDISILAYLADEKAVGVNATGISHTGNGIENIAYLTIHYPTGFIAHIHCSWSSPVKIRQTLIGGDRKMIIYNDLEPTEKVRIYDTSINMNSKDDQLQKLVDYRTGDILIPKVSGYEALSELAREFVDAVNGLVAPVSDAALATEVVRILGAAQHSIKQQGKYIPL